MYNSYYKQKSWCDAKDCLGIWRIGRIKKKTKNLVTVHFDGWSGRYKTVYCTHSNFIAPIRMHSRGYTGQEKVALREWEYAEENLRMHEEKMANTAANKFLESSAYDLTMYLRGDLFVLVDCLFGYTFSNPSRDVKRVESFFISILEFTEKWMIIARDIKPSADPKVYLESKSDAIYCAGFEIFEMIRSILGLNTRTAKFFTKYKIFTSRSLYCNKFMESGFEKFISLIPNYKFQDVWPLLSGIAKIIQICSLEIRTASIPSYLEIIKDCTLKKLLVLENNSQGFEFIKQLENLCCMIQSKDQAQSFMKIFDKSFLEIKDNKDSSDGSVVVHEDIPIPLEDLISPKKSKSNLIINNFTEAIKPHENPIRLPSVEKLKITEYEKILSLIERNHKSTIKLINETIFPKDPEFNNKVKLEEYFNSAADLHEEKVLNRLKFLLKNRNSLEALKLVRWRKKICKIAMMDGWEVADQISKATASNMIVNPDHMIQINLRNFFMRFDT